MKTRTLKKHPSLALAAAFSVLAMHGAAQAALVGYWNFDEGAGTSAADFSTNNNDGTFVGTPTWTTGHTGGGGDFALDFDANSTDGVTVNGDPSLNLGGSFTIAAWVYDRGGSTYGRVVDRDFGGASNYQLETGAGGDPNVYFWSGTDSEFQHNGGFALPNNAWHHYAATFDGSDLRLYLDGGLQNTIAIGGDQALTDQAHGLYIGRFDPSTTRTWDGYLDDVIIFNSVEDITQIMDATHPDMIPEPSAAVLLGFAGLGLLRRRRVRRG